MYLYIKKRKVKQYESKRKLGVDYRRSADFSEGKDNIHRKRSNRDLDALSRTVRCMKTLIKLFLILAAVFASTFVIIQVTGVLTIEDIRAWLEAAKSVSPWIIGLVVAGLLFADLFIAVPNPRSMLPLVSQHSFG